MAQKNAKKAPVEPVNNNVSEAVSRTEQFIENNKKKLTITVVAVIAVVAAVLLLNTYYFAPRQEKAHAALVAGEKLFQAGDFESALNGDNNEYDGFDAIIKNFKGTKAANLAKAYAGISHAQLGQFDEAINYLKSFKSNDNMIAPSVLGALANCYAGKEDYAQAAATFLKAAAKADNNTLSPTFLVQAGQLFEQMGKSADALKAYQQVKDKYYQSVQAADIDKYIQRVSK